MFSLQLCFAHACRTVMKEEAYPVYKHKQNRYPMFYSKEKERNIWLQLREREGEKQREEKAEFATLS